MLPKRGYTGHEMIDEFGLINMNGRIYDPQLCRFLSPDNYVQAPGNSQSFNRYSYCLNNPLKYTDPSGEEFTKGHLFLAICFGALSWGPIYKHSTGEYTTGEAVGMYLVSAAAFVAGGAVAWYMQGVVTTGGFLGGFAIGWSSGLTSGFIMGTGTSLIEGENLANSFGNGIKTGIIGGFTGGFIAGIGRGIVDYRKGYTFLDGSKVETFLTSPASEQTIVADEVSPDDEYLRIRVKDEYGVEEGDFNIRKITIEPGKHYKVGSDGLCYSGKGTNKVSVGGYVRHNTTGVTDMHISPKYTYADQVSFRAVTGHEIIHAYHYYAIPGMNSSYSEHVAYNYTRDVYLSNGQYSQSMSASLKSFELGYYGLSVPDPYIIPSYFRFYP